MPDAATLVRLFIGGAAGLAIWELWARGLTPSVIGGPLEPAGPEISLAKRFTGYDLPRFPAEVIHCTIGIVGYPVVCFAVSRVLPRWRSAPASPWPDTSPTRPCTHGRPCASGHPGCPPSPAARTPNSWPVRAWPRHCPASRAA